MYAGAEEARAKDNRAIHQSRKFGSIAIASHSVSFRKRLPQTVLFLITDPINIVSDISARCQAATLRDSRDCKVRCERMPTRARNLALRGGTWENPHVDHVHPMQNEASLRCFGAGQNRFTTDSWQAVKAESCKRWTAMALY